MDVRTEQYEAASAARGRLAAAENRKAGGVRAREQLECILENPCSNEANHTLACQTYLGACPTALQQCDDESGIGT
eukprot:1781951-Rhodomonas_salina.1